MLKPLSLFTCLLAGCISSSVVMAKAIWPEQRSMAISLSYDDTLASQLDVALPQLNEHGIKGAFYLKLSTPLLQSRFDEWRAAAQAGHELGNHLVYHPCSKSIPNRHWVAPYYDIDNYTLAELIDELKTANTFLQAIDGKTEHTFTAPCGDLIVQGESYIPHIREHVFAVKHHEIEGSGKAVLWVANGVSFKQIKKRIEYEEQRGTALFNILFHGVGGDFMAVSAEDHNKMLAYLKANEDTYWVDTYLNIMREGYKRGVFLKE